MADGGEREASSLSGTPPRRLSLAEEDVEGAASATWISDMRTPRTGGERTPRSSSWEALGGSRDGGRCSPERFGGSERLFPQSVKEEWLAEDVDGSVSEIGNLSDVFGAQWEDSGSALHGSLAGLRGERAESEASLRTQGSFWMVAPVEVTFVVQDFGPEEDGTIVTKQFASTPDYGELFKAARACLHSELNQPVKIGGVFMDGQQLNNTNARKIIKKVVEDAAAARGSNMTSLILHVACSGSPAGVRSDAKGDAASDDRSAKEESPTIIPQLHQIPEPTPQPAPPDPTAAQSESEAQITPAGTRRPAQSSEAGPWPGVTWLFLVLLLAATALAATLWDRSQKQAANILLLEANISSLEEAKEKCGIDLAARGGRITLLERDAARARREARERSADHEHTNMHLSGTLDSCKTDLKLCEEEVKDLESEKRVQHLALERGTTELKAAAERSLELEARLERLRASNEACRNKLVFKAPPRATSLQTLLFLADVKSAALTGSCEDFEGGHLTRVEWIQAGGPSLQLDGLITAHVVKDVPPGATYLSTNLTLSRHTEGIYRFTLRCTDNIDKVGETNVTVRFKHARHPVIRISGPKVITEGSTSSLQVSCSSDAPRVHLDIFEVDNRMGKTPDRVASSNRSTIDLSMLPFGDYNVLAACEDVTFSLWARDNWSIAVRHQGVLGVDLATTYSCVAFDDGSGPQQVFIREAGDDDDDPCMPSCVSFDPQTCFMLVGEPAKQQAAVNPGNTFCDIKNRLTGRRYSEAVVQDYIANASWYHIAPKCKYAVPGDPCDKPVLGVKCGGEQRFLEPEEISALMLDTMRLEAEAAAGHKLGPAVISVPAAWNNYQRKATLDSAAIAGLDCRQLVNEPTAAILHVESKLAAEDAGRPLEKKNVLVFDAGGGTTDVSILFVVIRNGRFEVIGTGGSPVLGGTDFDMALAESVLRPKLALLHPGETGLFDKPKGRALLRTHAEIVKKQLSTKDVAIAFIPWNEEGSVEKVIVRREDFENRVEHLIEKQVELIKATVKAADLELAHVDEVYFVGGQAQIPAVQRRIRELFGKAVVFHNEDPHSAVALGACRLASNHVTEDKRSASGRTPIRLAEVTPLQLGIEISGEEYSDEIAPLVQANSGIPLRIMKNFTNALDHTIEVRVLEGPPEARRASDPRAHLLGTFDVEDIPQHSTVTVEFGLDKNGVLNVGAHSKDQGNSMSLKLLSSDGHMSAEDIKRLEEVHNKLWSCSAGRYWQDLAASSYRLHQAMAAAALQPRAEPACNLFQRFMGTCDSAGAGSEDADAACVAAVRGLRAWAAQPGWVPPSVLTPQQVDELNYRAPNVAGARLDLVVLMDNTGSMARLIQAAQAGIKDIVSKIRESLGGVVVRVAVVGYRDQGEEYVVRVFQDFTHDVGDIQNAVDGMMADGGGDGPEAVLETLQVVPRLDFHPSAVKLALLVCDAPPHGVEPYDYDEEAVLKLSQAALRLQSMGIKVFPVLVEGTHQIDGYNNARQYYSDLAANTSGLVATLQDAETILVPFISNLATSEVNNAHVQSEVKRMSTVFDGTWSTAAMSEVILERMKKRGKLQRLMVDGKEVTSAEDRGAGRITPLRGVIGTVAADLDTSDVLDLVEQSVHK